MATKRQIFYSFHYDNDVTRVQQIRNIGALEDNTPVSHNDWDQTLVYLDASMTPNEQVVTRNYLYDHWLNYTDNHPDGRNELLKVYIGGTVGGSNALYLDHLVRSKYSSAIPF